MKQWDVIIHPYANFIGDLIKPLLKLGMDGNNIPRETMDAITYLWCNLK